MCVIHTLVFMTHMAYALRMSHGPDSSDFYRGFGSVIRRRRDTLGLTQAKLASQVGLTRASIANIETGRQKVLLHQLVQIAEALELAPADLLPSNNANPRVIPEDVSVTGTLNAAQKKQVYRLYDEAIPAVRGTRNGKY